MSEDRMRSAAVLVSRPAAFLKRKARKTLYTWLRETLGSDRVIDSYVTVRDHGEHLTISMWGAEREYAMSASLIKAGYIGLAARARAPLAGEQHRRGRDMWDGALTERDFKAVMRDIFLDMLVPVHHCGHDALANPIKGRQRKLKRRR